MGTKYAIKPIDCKIKSEVKLPWKPNKFFISVFSGKIKFGSSGEYEIKAINNKIPKKRQKCQIFLLIF